MIAIAPAQTVRPAVSSADSRKAQQAYLAGARFAEGKDFAAAQAEFSRAATLDPTHRDYALAANLAGQGRISALLQQAARARLSNDTAHAESLLAEARVLDPQNEEVLQHEAAPTPPQAEIRPSGKEVTFAPPLRLEPTHGPQDLHLRGDVRDVLTKAAQAFGLRAVVDESVAAQTLRFDLEGSPYTEAMPILLRMAHLFAVPIDAKTLLVLKDTQDNRQKYERLAEETIFVPGSTPEQLTELTNIVRNVFDVKQIALGQSSSTLAIRASEPTLRALNYTLADLIDGGAEVMMEVRLYAVDKTHGRNNGLVVPNSLGVFSVAAEAQSIVSANQTLINQLIQQGLLKLPPGATPSQILIDEALFLIASGLVTDLHVSNLIGFIGGGLTTAGVYLGSNTTLNLALNSSESRALEDITLRAGDRQTTTLRLGSKYPITTSSFSSGISGASSAALAGVTVGGVPAQTLLNQYLGSGASATIPQVQYEDLGITLKATPMVLKSGLITMHVDMKIEALTGASANGIPVLTSRAFTSDITVPEGETALMLSELSSTESAAVSGVPGLANLPGFKDTLADKLAERDSSELVMLVTPHVVRRRLNVIAGPRLAFQTSVPQDY